MADVKKIVVKIGADTRELEKGVKKSEKAVDGLGKTIKSVGGMIAGAFAVDRIARFGAEAIQLAANAEGVRSAFEKLNRPDLLNNLREATRGTVADLDLMKAAVRAENFKVPLDQLATFFDFATSRALETGESVDYLVNSIIDGIGRKSTLVMDNLGISATELQDEIKKTGDFGQAAANIISRSMAATGQVMDTTATKIAQLNARFKNTKEVIGKGLVEGITFLSDAFNAKFNLAQYAADMALRATNEALKEQADDLRSLAAVEERMGMLSERKKEWQAQEYEDWKKINSELQLAIALKQELADIENRIWGAAVEDASGFTHEGTRKATTNYGEWGYLDDNVESTEGLSDGLENVKDKTEELNEEFTNLGQNVGVMLVNQFANLGSAIGAALAGAEGALASLGEAIFQNIGNLLIMLGAQTGNVPLAIAGAAIQLGSGIFGGLRGAQTTEGSGMGGVVNFRVKGQDLVTSIDRTNYSNNLNT